jgi:hypothetical protein
VGFNKYLKGRGGSRRIEVPQVECKWLARLKHCDVRLSKPNSRAETKDSVPGPNGPSGNELLAKKSKSQSQSSHRALPEAIVFYLRPSPRGKT